MNTLWGWGRASWAGSGPDVRRGGQTLIMGYSADKSPLISHLAGPLRRLEPLGAQRQEKCGPNRPTPTGYSCNNAMMRLDLSAPDYTTLSRRSQHLRRRLRPVPPGEGLHLVLDSTGLSIVGEGEWAAAKHGGRGRRGWRKLHLGVDQSGVILVHTLTEATGDDATTALDLLNAVDGPLVSVTADGAYDTVAVYETATARGATVVIPPARTATVSGHGPRSPARDSNDHVGEAARPAPLEEGVRVPSSEPGGEHVLPLQIHHRRWPSRPESSWTGE